MSDTTTNPFAPFFDEIRRIVKEEVHGSTDVGGTDERLLSVEDAAQILSVSPDWLYRRANKLPFTRKLGPKALRFSKRGIENWLKTRAAIE